jgi:hypothetical protein
MIETENARLAAEESESDSHSDSDDDDEEDDEDDDDDEDAPPPPDRILRALAMTERALRLAPEDGDTQFAHAMILLDGDRAGLAGKLDTLLALLPTFDLSTRLGTALRLARGNHPRFVDALDLVLGDPLPARILEERADGAVHSFGDVSGELLEQLAAAILAHAPDRMPRLVAQLPDELGVLARIAQRAADAGDRGSTIALYGRVLGRPLPEPGEDRDQYLRAVNAGCIHAHALRDYATAVAIADRAQPYAAENPYIFHAAACAYAAVGDFAKAMRQVELAFEHGYPHLDKIEVDSDLGELLGWSQFQALFRDWHAREEGN